MTARIADPAGRPTMPARALPPGSCIDVYEVERVIAQGDFAIVYRAIDLVAEQVVAIKEYLPAALAQRNARQRVVPRALASARPFDVGRHAFVGEAGTLQAIEHESLVHVLAVVEDHGTSYRVMPFSPGPTLLEYRRALAGPPVLEDFGRWFEGLLGALEALHACGRLHGAVAPAKILMRPGERALLLDFSAVRHALGDDGTRGIDSEHEAWFSPVEKLPGAGPREVGPWTDLYSLAASLHYGLGGRLPGAPAGAGSTGAFEPFADVWRRVSPGAALPRAMASLFAALDACLAPEPDDRPHSVAALRTMLLAGGAGLGLSDVARGVLAAAVVAAVPWSTRARDPGARAAMRLVPDRRPSVASVAGSGAAVTAEGAAADHRAVGETGTARSAKGSMPVRNEPHEEQLELPLEPAWQLELMLEPDLPPDRPPAADGASDARPAGEEPAASEGGANARASRDAGAVTAAEAARPADGAGTWTPHAPDPPPTSQTARSEASAGAAGNAAPAAGAGAPDAELPARALPAAAVAPSRRQPSRPTARSRRSLTGRHLGGAAGGRRRDVRRALSVALGRLASCRLPWRPPAVRAVTLLSMLVGVLLAGGWWVGRDTGPRTPAAIEVVQAPVGRRPVIAEAATGTPPALEPRGVGLADDAASRAGAAVQPSPAPERHLSPVRDPAPAPLVPAPAANPTPDGEGSVSALAPLAAMPTSAAPQPMSAPGLALLRTPTFPPLPAPLGRPQAEAPLASRKPTDRVPQASWMPSAGRRQAFVDDLAGPAADRQRLATAASTAAPAGTAAVARMPAASPPAPAAGPSRAKPDVTPTPTPMPTTDGMRTVLATMAPAPAAARAKPSTPATRDPAASPPQSDVAPPSAPRQLCGDRRGFALYQCMQMACAGPDWSGHAQCLQQRRSDGVR